MFPKFIHYSAHAETLEYIFSGLQLQKEKRAGPGSALFFEFFKMDGDLFVRIFFKNDTKSDE